ncbi:YchJ family protein [Paraglaciecola polaris]|uniref:SEC-C motif domain protein n=1 Tax=Paraglaciecola polaris LMG 21857 TaxID=1129793 RepID=K6YJ71_9ALTE|nr:YchJ family protein [Paraglaciecola polaris]GAC32779.1 SEC-C motif domain protein [Paraglaciecola polaris LMG 21857]|tara:strand:- start:8465 stop:8941 length:477 start_codon:yes stop_codon:yes gene_type:complete
MNKSLCFCNSGLSFSQCCQPYLQGTALPETPEQLMRSRYSAYATKHFKYVLDTYALVRRSTITLQDLSQGSDETQWLGLDVIKTHSDEAHEAAEVEFIAYYRVCNIIYKMHERSTFCREENTWRYDKGLLFEDGGVYKPQRNALCLCGSGKKFKKCCL